MSHGHLSLVSPSNLIGGWTTNHIGLPQVRNDGPLKRNLFVRYRAQPICTKPEETFRWTMPLRGSKISCSCFPS